MEKVFEKMFKVLSNRLIKIKALGTIVQQMVVKIYIMILKIKIQVFQIK